MTILAKIWEHERDVNPAGAGLRVFLPDELIEWEIVLDIIEPFSPLLDVAVDAEVCGLALHVLRVVNAANGLVQSLTAKATAYLDRLVHGDAQRLQHVGAEIHKVYHLLHARLVVNSFRLGGRRGI